MAIAGAFFVLTTTILVAVFSPVRPISGAYSSYLDLVYFLIPFVLSPYLFFILITFDIWQRYFSNFLFRFHVFYLLSVLTIIPTVIATLLRGPGLGAFYYPSIILIVIGLVISFLEHLEYGFKPRKKITDKKAKSIALAGLLVAVSVGFIMLQTYNTFFYRSELRALNNNFLAYRKIIKYADSNSWQNFVSSTDLVGEQRIETNRIILVKSFDYSLAVFDIPNFSKQSARFPIPFYHRRLKEIDKNLARLWQLLIEKNKVIVNKKPTDSFTADTAGKWNQLTTNIKIGERNISLLLNKSR